MLMLILMTPLISRLTSQFLGTGVRMARPPGSPFSRIVLPPPSAFLTSVGIMARSLFRPHLRVAALTIPIRWPKCLRTILRGAGLLTLVVGALVCPEQTNAQVRVQCIALVSESARLKLLLALFGKFMTTLAESVTLGT